MMKSRLPWDAAVVNDAIDGVARRRGFFGTAADDWRQTAWLVLLRRANHLARRFRGACAPRTFLGTVLDHHCVDWLEGERRQLSIVDVRGMAADLARYADRSSAPMSSDPLVHGEDCLVEEDRLTRLRTALAQLTSEERLVLTLRFDGADARALSSRLGCTKAAARQRVHRAVVKLRQLMGVEPPDRRGTLCACQSQQRGHTKGAAEVTRERNRDACIHR